MSAVPGTLKDIICHQWKWFQHIIGDSRKDFCDVMDMIAKIRNPIKHNRPPELIPEDEYEKAKRACQGLLCRIDKMWVKHKNNQNVAE